MPTISENTFLLALIHRKSPAYYVGSSAYHVCVTCGVNPAVALAFFIHESNAGTAGIARQTLNWGNLRSGKRADHEANGFAYYTSWLLSLYDFCDLLQGPMYAGAGLKTVSEVLPKYAPSADNNDPIQYAAAVNEMIRGWS